MKIERTTNAVKNIKAGIALRIYQMIVPFLMRTAMIYFMGVEYLGLNSIFTSVLSVLNLAEMGVGVAMVFAMYKPIADDDEKTICALMALYRRYYRLIGLFVGTLGLLITPLIPRLIAGGVPEEINVYLLYILNLSAVVLSYWLFAYKNCLLQAHQRSSVSSIVTMICYTVQWVLQLTVLIFVRSYYGYILIALGTQAANNILTARVVSKLYPQYSPRGSLPEEKAKEINRKIRDIFFGKLGGVVLSASDTIVISAFLGLTTVAVYQNYNYIAQSVITIMGIILSSVTAGLGNSFILESKEKNFMDMEKFSFMFLWLTGICACCFLAMYQPFMELWVGRELMLDFGLVVCFVAYFVIYVINRFINIYKDAAGLWHKDKYRAMTTALLNLSLNLLWVRRWGLYGILLSTVISMACLGVPWMLYNLFRLFFNRKQLKAYLGQLLSFVSATAAAGLMVCLVCACYDMPPLPKLLISGLTALLLPNGLFYISFRKKKQFRESLMFLEKLTKGKLKFTRIS